MFERVVFLLLQGEFICAVSHPEEHRFLEDEGKREEVARYLSQVSRRIARTPHGSGYYLSFSHVGAGERDAVKAQFQEVKTSLAPVVLFFQMVMRATGREDLLMPGALIESHLIMSKIDQDAGLRNELQNVALISRATGADGAYRSMLDKLFGRLRTGGYLALVNAERGLYQVTAKLEYLLDVMRFIQENDPVATKGAGEADDDDSGQRQLA